MTRTENNSTISTANTARDRWERRRRGTWQIEEECICVKYRVKVWELQDDCVREVHSTKMKCNRIQDSKTNREDSHSTVGWKWAADRLLRSLTGNRKWHQQLWNSCARKRGGRKEGAEQGGGGYTSAPSTLFFSETKTKLIKHSMHRPREYEHVPLSSFFLILLPLAGKSCVPKKCVWLTCVRAEHSTYFTALRSLASFSAVSGVMGFCLFLASFSMVDGSSRKSIWVPTSRKGVFGQWWVISGTHWIYKQ